MFNEIALAWQNHAAEWSKCRGAQNHYHKQTPMERRTRVQKFCTTHNPRELGPQTVSTRYPHKATAQTRQLRLGTHTRPCADTLPKRRHTWPSLGRTRGAVSTCATSRKLLPTPLAISRLKVDGKAASCASSAAGSAVAAAVSDDPVYSPAYLLRLVFPSDHQFLLSVVNFQKPPLIHDCLEK